MRMETKDKEEFTVTDRGTDWEATVKWYGMGRGSTDEVSVSLQNDHAGEPVQRHQFRVKDADERECAFRKTSVDGESAPSRAAIKALGKYGWVCTNHDLDSIRRDELKNVGPTLQYIDDAIAGILEMNGGPVADYPFLLDVLELAQTATALVNTLIYPEYAPEVIGMEDTDGEYMEKLVDPEFRDVLRSWLAVECASDPYNRLYLPELAEAHFDITLNPEEIEHAKHSDVVDEMKMYADGPTTTADIARRPPGFDGIRYAEYAENDE